MKRDIYKKLMNLQSSEADTLLVKKFKNIDDTIRNASDNDEIYKQLEGLEQFVYKVSEQTIGLAKFLLDMDPLPVKVYKTQYGPVNGKAHEDIVKKVLDLLSRIRFYQTKEVINIYFDLYATNYEKTLEDKIRDIAKYDLQALGQIGYKPQMHIIDFLNTHENKDEKYIKFFIDIAKHLATPEGESHSMKDESTFVFGFAPLPFNKDIKHIREWLIAATEKLLIDRNLKLETRIKLVELLSSYTHGPHRGESSNELSNLIEQNMFSVVRVYEKAIMNNTNKLNLPLALEIEEKLIFMERGVKNDALLKSIDGLIKSLHENYAYSVYRVLVGAKLDFISRKDETYEEAQKSNEKDRKQLLDSINTNDSPAISVLVEVATYFGQVEPWKLNAYETFLSYFAKEKPDLAFELLEHDSEKQSAIMQYAGNFIIGFRNANTLEKYNKAIEFVVEGQYHEPVRLICFAMTLGELAKEDIRMASDILHREKMFSYLLKKDERSYHHYLMEVFIKLLPLRVSKYDSLFIELLNGDKDLSNLDFATIHRKIDFDSVSNDVRERVTNSLLKVPDVSYQHQELLLNLYSNNAEQIVDFFKKRATFKDNNPKLKSQDYDPVPYHLNENLTQVIKEDANYISIFRNAISGFTPEWSAYNSEVSQLFKSTGEYKEALLDILVKPTKTDLKKVLSFFDGINPIDLDVAVEIAKHTDDQNIWSSLRSGIYSTGVVSGEYGLANEHQRKYDYLKNKYSENKNKRIRMFVADTLKMLEAQVTSERQRTEESLRLRKVDFEH